jgi:hypothetical protein
MSYITDHKQKFDDLKLRIDNKDQWKKEANGGNSILFCYPPDEEQLYINQAQEIYQETAAFINVSKLLVKLVEESGWDAFSDYYRDFQSTPHKVFRSSDKSEGEMDLFDLIIAEINLASKQNKIPFIVRTGSLYGTGIENVNIMEHKIVMSLPQPLVIFYPSRIEGDNLYFLNFKPASKYRCILVK